MEYKKTIRRDRNHYITLWIYIQNYLQASPMVANASYPLSENRKDTLAVENQVVVTYLVRKGKSGKKNTTQAVITIIYKEK